MSVSDWHAWIWLISFNVAHQYLNCIIVYIRSNLHTFVIKPFDYISFLVRPLRFFHLLLLKFRSCQMWYCHSFFLQIVGENIQLLKNLICSKISTPFTSKKLSYHPFQYTRKPLQFSIVITERRSGLGFGQGKSKLRFWLSCRLDTDETASDVGVQTNRTDSTKETCLQECIITSVVFIRLGKHAQCLQ